MTSTSAQQPALRLSAPVIADGGCRGRASTVAELQEHLAASALELDPVDLAELDGFGDAWAPGPGTAVPIGPPSTTEEES